jgi:hypothetical protein
MSYLHHNIIAHEKITWVSILHLRVTEISWVIQVTAIRTERGECVGNTLSTAARGGGGSHVDIHHLSLHTSTHENTESCTAEECRARRPGGRRECALRSCHADTQDPAKNNIMIMIR